MEVYGARYREAFGMTRMYLSRGTRTPTWAGPLAQCEYSEHPWRIGLLCEIWKLSI